MRSAVSPISLHTVYATFGMCSASDVSADENKTQIAKSGALVPLTRLAKSKDMRVQRNATGALLNMTHSGQSSGPLSVQI